MVIMEITLMKQLIRRYLTNTAFWKRKRMSNY